jgi:predicted glycosyltransferase involved in capsule biosynthesis
MTNKIIKNLVLKNTKLIKFFVTFKQKFLTNFEKQKSHFEY